MEPPPVNLLEADEAIAASRAFLATLAKRRSIRHFSDRPVPFELVENAVRAAGLAPSGANQQPWMYVIVSDPAVKERMRVAIEREEYETYARRASDEWLTALAPLGTDWHKEHIVHAPYVVVVFAQAYGLKQSGATAAKIKHYYVAESVGISVGFFLASLTSAGLATLTHTPNPMGFLADILQRPENERAYVVIPVGYAAESARVPAVAKKTLAEILVTR
ncbi:MAG: nitroreductase family protein [Candidatus Eremiobacteraeota bacterium]|nr:nitroreductase family protein [Candidatus Eremiobacteraeota bacterium]MBC5801855.1 nitroreductase family protein [Candidatus Eremiobacteraeota bacterium]MBC5820997.1 nitroreductase family protein [Candidatus Eremiobacteraeota bacterium]